MAHEHATSADRASAAFPDAPREFSAGRPRFTDSAVAATARRDGALAAWKQAYAVHGGAAPRLAGGDFAVAVRLADGSSFLAVDRFAIRTLCYRIDAGEIHVAEHADALAGPAPEVDPQSIFDYLYFHTIPSPRTIFRNVFRLPPGHCAVFRKGELVVTPYWQPTFEEPRSASFGDLRDEFRAVLRESVAAQLDGSPIGCFLSGGTDSSTVVGMLREVTGAPARCFSIGFEAEGYDEMEYSRLAARHFGAEHHEYYVTPGDLVASIPTVAGSYDQPFGNASVVPAYYCARLARDRGVLRMLGGDGGDELFGGNTRYARQRVFGIYNHVPAALRNALLQPLLADNPLAARVPVVRKMSSYVNQARVPMPDRMETYNLIIRLGPAEVLTTSFLSRVDVALPLQHQRDVYAGCTAASLVNRMLAFDWRYTLAETDLPKVVGATALAGVNAGFPMLDDRLVAFSERLPVNYKLRGLKLRWFFKEALRGFLPDEIITKKKQGFGLPFGVWATRNPPLLNLATDSLHGLVDRGVLRREFVDTLIKQHLPAYPSYYGDIVWITMMLEQWLRAKAPGFRIG